MAKNDASLSFTISVCTGKSCVEKNSKKIRSKLKKRIKRLELGEKIRVGKCSCRGACGKGPILEVEPGGKLIKRVTKKRAKTLLKKLVSEIECDAKEHERPKE